MSRVPETPTGPETWEELRRMATVCYPPWPSALIESGYVATGKQLGFTTRLIEELRKRHIGEILLEVRAGNKSAIQFYNKQGFEKISVRKNYYMKNSNNQSQREDGNIMSTRIPLKENKNVL